MLIFDVLFVFLSACFLCAAFFQRRTIMLGLFGVALLALVGHLIIEGMRWQMAPAYLVFVICGLQLFRVKTGHVIGWRLGIPLIFCLLISIASSIILPVFHLSAPTGSYPTGVITRYLTDTSRPELHTEVGDDFRQLAVRIWYPAVAKGDQVAKYWPNDSARDSRLAEALGLPSAFGFLFSHVALVDTHSAENAAAAAGKHPILIFSHGLNLGFSGQNTMLMEHLASHGYIVASIDHTFWGFHSTLEDGRVIGPQQVWQKLTGLWDAERPAELLKISEQVGQNLPIDQLKTLMHRLIELRPQTMQFLSQGIELWSADQRFVLDQLEAFHTGDPLLANHLNLTRIGVFGMSFGGTVSLHTCTYDTRCQAGINIDGFQAPSIQLPPLQAPFLYLVNETNYLAQFNHYTAVADSWLIRVGGTVHANFSDFALLSPMLRGTALLGEIEGRHGLEITNAYVGAFFDQTLLNKGQLLSPATPIATEVSLDFRQRHAP